MFYRDVPVTDWVAKYPELEVINGICDNCGTAMPTVQPFETRATVGLESIPCTCGQNRFKAICSVDKGGKVPRDSLYSGLISSSPFISKRVNK